jgi:hypothetical protein
MSEEILNIVGSNENVVRILSKDWVANGIVQQTAFTLRDDETYISVNRPTVASYITDVASFIRRHKNFMSAEGSIFSYQRANLNVGDVRGISVVVDGQPLAIDVEVEPRDVFTKSHAGIFTRYGKKNVKAGSTFISVTPSVSGPLQVLQLM